MKLTLVEEIISTEDLRGVIEEVKEYKKWFIHNQIKLKVSQRHKVSIRPELSNAAEALLDQANDGKELTATKIEDLIGYLEHCLIKSPLVRITLAAIPSAPIKHKIVAWLRTNISPSMLGGMVVISGSHIYDWSLRRQLLESKDKLDGVLRRV